MNSSLIQIYSALRGNPVERKRAGGREKVDESPDREEDGGEKNFRARFEREEKGERVREEER